MSIPGEIIQDSASYISGVSAAMQAEQNWYRTTYADYLSDLTAPWEGKNQKSNTTISMTDYTENQASNVIVVGTSGNDIFYDFSESRNVTIFGGAGNDNIESDADQDVTILGDAGNDTIRGWGHHNLLLGGDGNDKIYNHLGNDVSIRGGKGDDYLAFDEWFTFTGHYISYQYAKGDGNDTIDGWTYGSTLFVEGSYTTVSSASVDGDEYKELVVRVGNGSITILNRGDEIWNGSVKIETVPSGTFSAAKDPVAPSVTSTIRSGGSSTSTTTGSGLSSSSVTGSSSSSSGGGSYTSTTTGSGSSSSSVTGSSSSSSGGGSYTSTTTGSGSSSSSVTGSSSSTVTSNPIVYTGGYQGVWDYAGEPIRLGTFSSAEFFNGTFMVLSPTGELTIFNAADKIIDLRDASGGEFLKAYQASSAGVVDGRGINAYEIIEGSAAGMDVILAGDGGSQLWGGSGNSADAIAGGNGSDIFIGGRYQGADVFYNASSADVVNLTDATLSDIVAAVEVNGNIAIGFNTGNIITIQSTELLSAAVNLADGSSWRFNHVTKSWQGA